MANHPVTSQDEWVAARKRLLIKEKEFSKLRDEISAARRDLPWVKIDKPYSFDTPAGKRSLADLFDGRSQLLVYHFMFDPSWEAGCKSCSFLTDHYQGAIAHLAAKDVTLVAVSRAPLAKLISFKKRMGWTHSWVSSHDSDFNFDFHVSFSQAEIDDGSAYYNYAKKGFPVTEGPGLSVFLREGDSVYHTYSTFARGLDPLIGTYNFLDLVPKGRNEADSAYSMAWVRLHDEY